MWRRARGDEDFSREIEAHLEHEADRLVADGMTPEEARRAARRAFGNVLAVRERFHDAHGWLWLDQFAQDVRYGWRGLRHSPAFLCTAVLTLAVSLGIVTSAFAVFNAYVLRPFAVREPHSLRQIAWRARDAAGSRFRWSEYEELQQRRELFEDAIASTTRLVSWQGRPLIATFVSGNYFEVLGPGLQLGRALASFDAATPGAGPVAVLSDEGWARMFDRDAAAIGRTVDVNGVRLTIVGILRPAFGGLEDTPRDLFIPLTMFERTAHAPLSGTDQPRELTVVARLRRGITPTAVAAALQPFATRAAGRPDVRAEARWQATPNPLTADLLMSLAPVFAAFLLVLVTACANVSNLMLARATARYRETAMRLSLGAGRGRIVRQMLAEGMLIAVLAGALGIVIAVAALRVGTAAFLEALPPSIAGIVRVAPLTLDIRVFLFACVAAWAATLLFALAPALQTTRLSLMHALRGTSDTAGRSRLRQALVVTQVTVSMVLLVAALTVVRNGLALDVMDLGFEPRGLIAVTPRGQGVEAATAARALIGDPQVSGLAAASRVPLSEQLPKMPLVPRPGAAVVATSYTFVSPGYFELLGVPIVRGRGFTEAEARAEAPVAVVSAAAAHALWPDVDPIGRTLSLRFERIDMERGNTTRLERHAGDDSEAEIVDAQVVGVAADAVSGLLVGGMDPAHLYLPTTPDGPHAASLLLRGRGADPKHYVQERLGRVHADPLAFEVVPVTDLRDANLFPLRAASWIGALLGGIALALSISGLYGVLSYLLSQRTREIGIRMALGATSRVVAQLVVAQSTLLVGVGAALGLAIALAVMKTAAAFVELRGVSLLDAPAFGMALVLVAVAAVVGAFVPSYRATLVDPAETLRADT